MCKDAKIVKKYLLLPGSVISRRDGQPHYISAGALMHLYNVPMSACVIFKPLPRGAADPYEGLVKLAPRYNGDYTLKETK